MNDLNKYSLRRLAAVFSALFAILLVAWFCIAWLEGRVFYQYLAEFYGDTSPNRVLATVLPVVPGLFGLSMAACLLMRKRLPRLVAPSLILLGVAYVLFPFQIFLGTGTGSVGVKISRIPYGFGSPVGCLMPLTGPHWAVVINISKAPAQ